MGKDKNFSVENVTVILILSVLVIAAVYLFIQYNIMPESLKTDNNPSQKIPSEHIYFNTSIHGFKLVGECVQSYDNKFLGDLEIYPDDFSSHEYKSYSKYYVGHTFLKKYDFESRDIEEFVDTKEYLAGTKIYCDFVPRGTVTFDKQNVSEFEQYELERINEDVVSAVCFSETGNDVRCEFSTSGYSYIYYADDYVEGLVDYCVSSRACGSTFEEVNQSGQ